MTGNDESVLFDTEVQYLRSEHVGDEFKLFIGHCGSLESPGCQVVFLGDAWGNFGTAVDILRLLRLTDSVAPLLVVGIGHRATIDEIWNLRARDFTPNADLAGGYPDATGLGGADRFLSFIRDELKPWLRERYGADPDDSTYFGYSLGGLFATHALLSEPATFRRYAIGSPSLWWDKELMFRREAEYAEAHDDLAARVVFSIGAYENVEGQLHFMEQLPADKRARAEAENEADPAIDMIGMTERMVGALRGRAYPSLEIEYELLAGEYHETGPPAAMSRSLRRLLGAPL